MRTLERLHISQTFVSCLSEFLTMHATILSKQVKINSLGLFSLNAAQVKTNNRAYNHSSEVRLAKTSLGRKEIRFTESHLNRK